MKLLKRLLPLLLMLCLLTAAPCARAESETAAERGLEKLKTACNWDRIVLPKEESYLQEWKTGYARKAFKAPCLRVERISQLRTGRQVMPYIYEGVEATVVAEENNMSCMIYRGNDNQLYAGWIQSIRLLDEFPGNEYTVGKEPGGEYTVLKDITVDPAELFRSFGRSEKLPRFYTGISDHCREYIKLGQHSGRQNNLCQIRR